MSVAARVSEEMGTKLGNEVRSVNAYVWVRACAYYVFVIFSKTSLCQSVHSASWSGKIWILGLASLIQ